MKFWQSVFRDILNVMGMANQKLQQFGPQSDEYWLWLTDELSKIELKYKKQRLVVLLCTAIFQFQDEKFYETERKQ